MIRIALEVSTIGLGQIDRWAGYNRTGIYRVTEELTKEMLVHPDIEPSLLFWEFPYTSTLANNYLQKLGYDTVIINKNLPMEDKLYSKLMSFSNVSKRFVIINLLSGFLRKFRSRDYLKEMDIIHSLYYQTPSIVNPQKTIRFRTIHDLFPLTHPEYFPKKYQKAFRRSFENIDILNDWFFAVSESTKNDFCNYFKVTSDRVIVTPLAASVHQYYHIEDQSEIDVVKKQLNLPEGEYFLNIATLEPRKNLMFLVKCFKRVIKSIGMNKNYYLVLIGKKGWMIDSLYRKIQSDPILREKVILPGFIPDKMLSKIYSGALAFVYPSLCEGFGLPVLEAMQCGTPVITSNRSSLPEVVGKAGLLVDPENEDDMCQAMINLMEDQKLRSILIQKGIERAKLFSWKECAENTVKGYQVALESKA